MKVTFTETGKTAVWGAGGGNKSSIWDTLSLCPHASQSGKGEGPSVSTPLRNVGSTAITLHARKQDWTEVIQEGVQGRLPGGGTPKLSWRLRSPRRARELMKAATSEYSPLSSSLHLPHHTQQDRAQE